MRNHFGTSFDAGLGTRNIPAAFQSHPSPHSQELFMVTATAFDKRMIALYIIDTIFRGAIFV